ncbi:hypothetical protein P8C59_007181 [Phyllachora maydis]|uniref:Uncharacterized protein n=1 Tax=Phyllachora maydis TaxID=1825666 RepID=A0AAD9I880_9PEZI|nr:hypothetical protein P8C59_007181 [Phyllachora maydis]
MEDCQTTTSTTAKETAIDAITIVPIVPSSSAPPTINAPAISAPLLTNVVAVKGLIVYNRVIEEGLLEEAKKQYPIVVKAKRQLRRPVRRGAIGPSTNSNSNSSNSNNTNIDSLSDLDNSVYNIPAPIPAKPAKITPARSKRTAGSNTGRYITDSGLIANKDDNNAYNGAYVPPADIEEEEEKEGSGNNDGVNGSTSDSADKGEGSGIYKHGKGALRYKDTLLYKRQHVMSYPCSPSGAPCADIYVYCVQVVTAGKGRGPNNA